VPAALIACLPIGLLLLGGCGRGQTARLTPPGLTAEADSREPVSGKLTVFVPCGIAGPYGEIKELFEQRNPGIEVTQEVANIDVQTKLILDGKATPDVWISLGDQEVARTVQAGKVDGKPVTYAHNSLAMIVAKGNPCGVAAVEDLAKPAIKTVALPSEQNSSGYYMRQALEQAEVWSAIQGKLWVTDEPAQVKLQLAAGKADAGVVYFPCTRETHEVHGQPQEMKGKVQLLGKIPTELSGLIPAQAAVINGCENPRAGRAFCEFLLEDKVQGIWENWGFDRVKQPASGRRVTLYLYCGAGIRPFMDPAVEAYRQVQPNVRVDVGYAGSGCLLSQLTFARRGDLYMPGEDFYLGQARERGFITGQELVGYFEPVLLVQEGNPKGIETIDDLARPGLKVGVGEPEACAVGRAAEAVLRAANLAEAAEANIVLRAGNVPELGNAVKLKSLDVAIVWNVTAAQVADSCDEIRLPHDLYQPSPIPVGVLKFSEHPAEAKAFVEFCAGPKGQELVVEAGMVPARAEAVALR